MIDLFMYYFNLNGLNIYEGTMLVFMLLMYIIIAITDIKYKEIALWQILATGGLNLISVYTIVMIYGCPCLSNLGYLFIIWPLIVYLNGKFNKETIIGQADIDLFSLNILISFIILMWAYNGSPKEVALINVFYLAQLLIGSIIVGLILAIFIWFITGIIQSVKTKIKLKEILLSEQKYIPALVAVIPLFLVNTVILFNS